MDELRVTNWDSFIGQSNLKERLDMHIKAAVKEERSMEHVLLHGPPGFGKTSLGNIISKQLGRELSSYTMPLNERALRRIVGGTSGVILLDEIHRATPKEQELLLPVLESGKFYDRRGYLTHVQNPYDFTIVAATTERHKLIAPLVDRFPIKPDFDPYSAQEMSAIVRGMARKVGILLTEADATTLGKATGGIPRVARQFILAARDMKIVNEVTPTARDILSMCRVTEDGLTVMHVEYLHLLAKNNGSAGLRTIRTHLGVNDSTVMEIERLLIASDLMVYTDQGRELTPEGYKTAKDVTKP